MSVPWDRADICYWSWGLASTRPRLSAVHEFDFGFTGSKPKGFAKAGSNFSFVTEGGGTRGLGVLGVMKDG